MHDGSVVRSREGVGDLVSVGQRAVEMKLAAGEHLRECLAFQVLHHQEIHAVIAADVIERADVRMAQGCD